MIELLFPENNVVLIDDEDHSLVKIYRWYILKTPRPYVASHSPAFLYMHRLLMNAPKGYVVDHVNLNTLDNRKKNLRVCKQSENALNRGPSKKPKKHGQSPFKGVWRVSEKKISGNRGGSPFEARISINGTQRYIGAFDTAEDAARAYDAYAETFHGAFARLNFPKGVTC